MADNLNLNRMELRVASNQLTTVGTVSEYNITIKECERTCNIDGEEKKIKSAWINGDITIDVNKTTIKHSFTYLNTIKHTKNGEQSNSFKGLMTAFGYEYSYDEKKGKVVYNKITDGLIPTIKGTITFQYLDNTKEEIPVNRKQEQIPTRVKITGALDLQEGLNKDQSDLAFYNNLAVKFISTTNVPDTDDSSFIVEGFVKDIVNEMNNNGGTTGRYLIDLIVPDFFGIKIMNFVMLDKWINVMEDGEEVEITKEMFHDASDPNTFCKVRDTVLLSGKIEGHTVGTQKVQSSKTFGGGAIINSFTRIEWTVKSGDSLNEFEDKKYDKDLIEKAIVEYNITLDNNYQTRLKSYQESQAKKNNEPKRGMGMGVNTVARGSSNTSTPFETNRKANPFG